MQSKLEEIFTRNTSDNLRKYLLSAGYIFEIAINLVGTICFISNGRKTKEKAIDVNLKAYKTLDFGKYLVGYPIEEVLMVEFLQQ
jgi:hypothetical protein